MNTKDLRIFNNKDIKMKIELEIISYIYNYFNYKKFIEIEKILSEYQKSKTLPYKIKELKKIYLKFNEREKENIKNNFYFLNLFINELSIKLDKKYSKFIKLIYF